MRRRARTRGASFFMVVGLWYQSTPLSPIGANSAPALPEEPSPLSPGSGAGCEGLGIRDRRGAAAQGVLVAGGAAGGGVGHRQGVFHVGGGGGVDPVVIVQSAAVD